jgi:glyoxylase-like metal-dependent hydrolase (beta-lactamase superfamily II)
MNRVTLSALAGAAVLLAGAAWAQQPAPAAPAQAPDYSAVQVRTTDLGHRTWMLEGAGGNVTVIAGDDAVIMVDTQFAPMHDKLKAAIAAVAPQLPIHYVVDTHLHGDHTGGNAAFHADGAVIVGHVQLKQSMAQGTTNALTRATTPPAPEAALPTKTYGGDRTVLTVKGRTVQLIHVPRAHTGGDTIVWIPDAHVLATGDIISVGKRYPNIDVGDGGGIDGMIAGVDACLERTDSSTRFVPGHGPLMTKSDLAAYRVMLDDARMAVKALKAQGLSEDDVVAARPLATGGPNNVQARAGANDQQSATFVRLIYRSVG